MKKSERIACGLRALRRGYDIQRDMYLSGEIDRMVRREESAPSQKRLVNGSYVVEQTALHHFRESGLSAFVSTREFEGVRMVHEPEVAAVLTGLNDVNGYLLYRKGLKKAPRDKLQSDDGESTLSALSEREFNTPFGMNLALSHTARPRYRDFDFAGFVDFVNGRLVYGVAGEGAYEISNVGRISETKRKLPTPHDEQQWEEILNGKRQPPRNELERIIRDFNDTDDASLYVPCFARQEEDCFVEEWLALIKNKAGLTSDTNSTNGFIYDLMTRSIKRGFYLVSDNVRGPPVLFTLLQESGGAAVDILDGLPLADKFWEGRYGREVPYDMSREVLFASSQSVIDILEKHAKTRESFRSEKLDETPEDLTHDVDNAQLTQG